MLGKIHDDIEELKMYYSSGKVTSIKEGVCGVRICNAVLKLIDVINKKNLSDMEKVKELEKCVDKKIEEEKTTSTYEPLSSSSGYSSIVLNEIRGIIIENITQKTIRV